MQILHNYGRRVYSKPGVILLVQLLESRAHKHCSRSSHHKDHIPAAIASYVCSQRRLLCNPNPESPIGAVRKQKARGPSTRDLFALRLCMSYVRLQEKICPSDTYHGGGTNHNHTQKITTPIHCGLGAARTGILSFNSKSKPLDSQPYVRSIGYWSRNRAISPIS